VPAATGIKRVGIAVASILAAGLALLLVLSLMIPADTVREAVRAQIRTVTGLEPQLRGDVAVSLFPTGSVRFNDVSLGDNRTGASALSAQQLLVRLRFLPFLIGRIEIADVTLVRPTVMIAFAADGSSNWAGHIETLARALQPDADRVNSFSEIRISDGTVIVRDEGFRIVETLSNVEFALAWPSISRTFAATGRFNWRDQPIEATLSLSDFLAALSGDRSGLKVRLAGVPLKLAFDGNMSYRPTLRMEGVLAADAPSLRETLRWAADRGSSGTGLQRFALKAQTNIVGRNISLLKANIELDGNSGEGVLTFAADGRQTLQGTLAVEDLDLTPYVSAFRFLTTDRSWSRMALDLDALTGLDVDLRLSAARVTLDNLNFGRTAVTANLRGGNLTVAIGESLAFGGAIKGSFALAKSGSDADLDAQLQLNDVLLDQAFGAFFGVRKIEGRGNIGIALNGRGGSIYDLTTALNGSVTVNSRKGAIAGVNVEQSLKRLERNPLAVRGSDFRGGKTAYEELAVNLRVADGIAHVEDVRIETPGMRIGMEGSTSIPARNFDIKGTASLLASTASDAPPAFQLPFVVLGTWDDPLFWPDIQLLIRRSGAAAPLLDAVRSQWLQRNHAPDLAGESAVPIPAPPALQPTSTPR
jgi:AsmA protein